MKGSSIADVSLCSFETWVCRCLRVGLNLLDREWMDKRFWRIRIGVSNCGAWSWVDRKSKPCKTRVQVLDGFEDFVA